MPASTDFLNRLSERIDTIADHYGTPFHIYDEAGIRNTGESLKQAFSGISGFQEYFAVKALPNPRILELMAAMGFGFDCSSIAELRLSRRIGAPPPIPVWGNSKKQQPMAVVCSIWTTSL